LHDVIPVLIDTRILPPSYFISTSGKTRESQSALQLTTRHYCKRISPILEFSACPCSMDSQHLHRTPPHPRPPSPCSLSTDARVHSGAAGMADGNHLHRAGGYLRLPTPNPGSGPLWTRRGPNARVGGYDTSHDGGARRRCRVLL